MDIAIEMSEDNLHQRETPHGLRQCRWLDTFFGHIGDPKDTIVAVIDSHGTKGDLAERIFIECKDSKNESLAHALRMHPLDIVTRIVILVHGAYDEVHREAVRTLRSTYNLDPLFLMSHFCWDDRTSDEPQDKDSKFVAPISLPSLVHFLALDYQGQFSGILLKDINPPTGKSLRLFRS